MFNDVARAYPNAPYLTPTFVDICGEDYEEGHKYLRGELMFSMYGTRLAALNWQLCDATLLTDSGFKFTKACACIMRHEQRDLDLTVHGDDFVTVGAQEDSLWLKGILESKFEISTVSVGHQEGDERDAKVFNRIITEVEGGSNYEADARHAELIIWNLRLQNANDRSCS